MLELQIIGGKSSISGSDVTSGGAVLSHSVKQRAVGAGMV